MNRKGDEKEDLVYCQYFRSNNYCKFDFYYKISLYLFIFLFLFHFKFMVLLCNEKEKKLFLSKTLAYVNP